MRQRKTAEARKAEIVDATLRLADRLGPDRLTTEAVAAAVGITQPGIFRHFPRKQDLWDAVAAHLGAVLTARWARATSRAVSPSARLRALVGAQLSLIQSTPAIPAILFSRELHTRNKRLRGAFHRLIQRFHQTVVGLVAEARDAGELRADLDPDDAAFVIVALVQGLAVRWSVGGRKFDLAAEGLRLVELQLRGFARVPAGALDGAS